MDPYLEGHLWTSLHAELATGIAHQLMPHLRPKYIALPERKYLFGSRPEISHDPHYRIEIQVPKSRKAVTIIEFLSPTNKGAGRKQYLDQRRHDLTSSANLLEIDLHHQGSRVPMARKLPPGSYFVLLSRAEKRPTTEVWPIAIHEPLPVVPVPLLKGDPDVPLNLQEAFAKVYNEGGFDLVVDYRQPPDVELSSEEAAWLDQHLRSTGLRS
jgi:hypothetical protein